MEKNINLTVALRFGKYVEQNMPEVRVIYTRKQDVFIPLHERANIANRANADLFISVHTNALPAGKVARGFETYTLGMHRAKDNLDVAMRENSVISMEKGFEQTYEGFDPKSSESYIIFEFIQGKNMERSVELARMIQRSVCDSGCRPDKGVHQAGFLVLRETSMPSCLIELGFITTPDEERLLNDNAKVDDIAKGIYEAFAKYKNKYDRSVSVPYRAANRQESTLPKIVPDSYKEEAENRRVKKQEPVRRTRASKTDDSDRKADTVASQSRNAPKDAPVFKLQIFVGNRNLRKGDAHFKGETEFDSFQEVPSAGKSSTSASSPAAPTGHAFPVSPGPRRACATPSSKAMSSTWPSSSNGTTSMACRRRSWSSRTSTCQAATSSSTGRSWSIFTWPSRNASPTGACRSGRSAAVWPRPRGTVMTSTPFTLPSSSSGKSASSKYAMMTTAQLIIFLSLRGKWIFMRRRRMNCTARSEEVSYYGI